MKISSKKLGTVIKRKDIDLSTPFRDSLHSKGLKEISKKKTYTHSDADSIKQ